VNRKAQLICVACGPLCAIGAVFLAQFIPPLVDPQNGAHTVATKFAEHTDRIRIGALISVISMSLVGPWGVTVAAQTRRTEGDFPILTYVQLICVAVGTCVVVLMCTFWACAAFRPGVYTDQTVMVLNDVAYFLFLFTWAPFAIWALAIALAIFLDPSEVPVYPRYVAYVCLWVAVLFVPAGLMAFFKSGPFAWNGVMALYVPVGIFFVWLAVLTYETVKNINRGFVFTLRRTSASPGAVQAPTTLVEA
jgi:hypothetical protein